MATKQLIFVAALKAELPMEWLKSMPICVRHLNDHNLSDCQTAQIAILLTGVGPKAASSAADWIKHNLNPIAVINIGTAGSLNKENTIGGWHLLNSVKHLDQPAISLDQRIPFPWPETLPLTRDNSLLSVEEFSPDLPPQDDAQLVDMEAYTYAVAFKNSTFSFHCFKMLSDFNDKNLPIDFKKMLKQCRSSLENILEFLRYPTTPRISVIIPTFNRIESVRAAISSVHQQTLKPLEIIVIDDGSNDEHKNGLNNLDIKLIQNKENRGVSFSRNRAASEASGDWLAFLDSDDTWEPNKLASQWNYLKQRPYLEIMQSEEKWIRNGTRVNAGKQHQKPEGWIWEKCLERCLISPSSVLITKHLFECNGGFDENLRACEDYDLWLRISRNHLVGLEPTDSLIKFGGHSDQLSQRFDCMDLLRVYALWKQRQNEESANHLKKLDKAISKRLQILANGCLKRDKKVEAEAYLTRLKRLETEPFSPYSESELISWIQDAEERPLK